MKPNPLVLFVALLLSLTFLAGKTLAQEDPFPTQPQPPAVDSGDFPNPTEMNLNFVGAAMFPQVADTFVPLTETLEDVEADDEPPCVNPIVFTKRDALENTTAENIITMSQGQWIKIDLGKSLIEGTYDHQNSDYLFKNPWSLQQDNKNLNPLVGGWEDEGARPVFPPKKQWSRMTEKYGVYYCLYAAAVGEVTLTFTYHGQFSTAPKVLTFRFNIVEAPAAPASSGNEDGSNGK
ncbi:MAG: hypothetical protein K2W97_06520 [Chthoniobacterales bacterium]|nr:hypothetical protein [Chthoniobacterales bacterium]